MVPRVKRLIGAPLPKGLLIPLTLWFLIFMSINIGEDYVDVKSSLEQPFNIIMMSLFIIATLLHLQQANSNALFEAVQIRTNLVYKSLLFYHFYETLYELTRRCLK